MRVNSNQKDYIESRGNWTEDSILKKFKKLFLKWNPDP